MTAVLAAAARRLTETGGAVAADAAAILDQLTEPLRVAVVGRVSAGKSTLVNALLAQAVAPTGAGETTQVPCWFRHGRHTTAAVRDRDGRLTPVSLVDGHLPDTLPPHASGPGAQLELTLPVPMLRTATVVDTPGIASVNDAVAARTAELLTAATGAMARRVEALLVVLTGPLHADEAAAVASLNQAVPAIGPVPAIAVLTRVDTLAADPRAAFAAGEELAARLAETHDDLFSAVVPVAGLIGATAACASLTEADARNLRALAQAWDGATRSVALADARLLRTLPAPVPDPARGRLVDLLGLAGIRLCLDHLDSAPTDGAGPLTDLLASASGLNRLVRTLNETLDSRADLLKAGVAAESLRRASLSPGVPGPVADQVADLLDSPALHPLELTAALAALPTSHTPLPSTLATLVTQARAGKLPPLNTRQATAAVAAWASWALIADGAGRRAARAMSRALQTSVKGTA